MKALLKITTAAAALLGSVVLCGPPASATDVDVGVGPIGFDIHTGGYCDRWGCPQHFWKYPIFYGPVYYEDAWYRGPVYYRVEDGVHWYWIHGGWHRNQWEGPRPEWARVDHYGPALPLDYYREHGFRVSERDWRNWNDRYGEYRAGYNPDEERYREDQNWYENREAGYRGNEDRYREDQYQDRGPYNDEDRYNQSDEDRYERMNNYRNGQGPEDYTRGEYDRGQYRGDDQYHGDEMGPPSPAGFEQEREPSGHAQPSPFTGQQGPGDEDQGPGPDSGNGPRN